MSEQKIPVVEFAATADPDAEWELSRIPNGTAEMCGFDVRVTIRRGLPFPEAIRLLANCMNWLGREPEILDPNYVSPENDVIEIPGGAA